MKPISDITRSDWPKSWSKSVRKTTVTKIETTTTTQTPTTTAEPIMDSDNEPDLGESLPLDQPVPMDTDNRPLDTDRQSLRPNANEISGETRTKKIRTGQGRSRSGFEDNGQVTPAVNGSSRSIRRRSNHHLAICRREFLRPLSDRSAASDLVFTGIVERIHKRPTAYHRSRRHHHGDDKSGAGHSSLNWYRGIVRVKRVIKGDKEYENNRLMIEGLGSRKICDSDVKSGRKWIIPCLIYVFINCFYRRIKDIHGKINEKW